MLTEQYNKHSWGIVLLLLLRQDMVIEQHFEVTICLSVVSITH